MMSPSQDPRHAPFVEALTGWAEQLAAGRSWIDIEDEILTLSHGRVDVLTALLLQAEALRGNTGAATRRAYAACA